MKKTLRINNINEGELSGKKYYDLRNRIDNPIDKNLELIWKENQHNYVFIRFTNAKNKALELNPNYSYSTPFGYYAYPFNQKWINNIKERNIPFAFEYNHCVIFSWDPSKSDKRTIVLDENGEARGYTKKHFAQDLRLLEEYIYQNAENILSTSYKKHKFNYELNKDPSEDQRVDVEAFINDALKTSIKETLFNKIFNLSRLIGKNARKWTEILRNVLNISCILDLKDSASIHVNEPTQCVFFEPNKAHLLLDEDNILKNTKFEEDGLKYQIMKGSGYEINWKGVTLYRIKALKTFGYTGKGVLGGFIQSEHNLSQKGDSFIEDQGKVYGNAQILENAILWEKAEIYGSAVIKGNARVEDRSKVYGNAVIDGNARVGGESEVYGETLITDKSRILDNCRIFDKSVIFGDSLLRDNTIVCGNSGIESCKFSGDSFIKDEDLLNTTDSFYKYQLYNDYKSAKSKLKINNIPSTDNENDPTKDPNFVNKVW